MAHTVNLRNHVYLRILKILLIVGLLTGILCTATSVITNNVFLIRYKEEKDTEQEQLTKVVEGIEQTIKEQQYTFLQVLNQDLFQNIKADEIYMSGPNGRIYLNSNQKSLDVTQVNISMNEYFIYTVQYSDGAGFLLIKQQTEAVPFGSYRFLILIGGIILFLGLAVYTTGKLITQYGKAHKQEEREAKLETNIYTLFSQYAAEAGLDIQLEELEKQLNTFCDYQVLVQVLDFIFEKFKSDEISIQGNAEESHILITFILRNYAENENLDKEQEKIIRRMLKRNHGSMEIQKREKDFYVFLKFS